MKVCKYYMYNEATGDCNCTDKPCEKEECENWVECEDETGCE